MEIRNAVIESVTLTTADYDLPLRAQCRPRAPTRSRSFCPLSGWLHLDYGGSGQGFGGHVLYLPKGCRHHEIKSLAGHWIYRVMQIAGVSEWSKLPGKAIRVRATHSGVYAIGHIVKDDWFEPALDFKAAEGDR